MFIEYCSQAICVKKICVVYDNCVIQTYNKFEVIFMAVRVDWLSIKYIRHYLLRVTKCLTYSRVV